MSFTPQEITALTSSKPKEGRPNRGKHNRPHNPSRGEKHGKATLTDAQVQEIRDIRESTGRSYPDIGRQFGVSGWTIRDIVTFRTRAK